MKIKIFNFNKNKLAVQLSENRSLLIFFALFIAAFTVGVFYTTAADGASAVIMKRYISAFLKLRLTGNFFDILLKSLLSGFAALIIFFLFGLGVTGVCLVPAFLSTIGLFCGIFITSVYVSYSLSGVGFCALVVVAPALIILLGLISAAKNAFAFSKKMAQHIGSDAAVGMKQQFKVYLFKFVILLIPAAAYALLDATLSKAFIGLFNF